MIQPVSNDHLRLSTTGTGPASDRLRRDVSLFMHTHTYTHTHTHTNEHTRGG